MAQRASPERLLERVKQRAIDRGSLIVSGVVTVEKGHLYHVRLADERVVHARCASDVRRARADVCVGARVLVELVSADGDARILGLE